MRKMFNLMLDRYEIKNLEDARNAIKQCLQEIILCGLAREGFFKHATFYGGTALRIIYNLNRFSEDLDFVLTETNHTFNLERYFPCIINELKAKELNFNIEHKAKSVSTNVLTAKVKGNLKEILDTFFDEYDIKKNINKEEVIVVKMDVSTNSIEGGTRCFKVLSKPEMFQVTTYDLPTLFAEKICACLTRGWKTRVKGRDFFDFVFFIERKVKVNLPFLKTLLVNGNVIDKDSEFNLNVLKEMLIEKFNIVNFDLAKADVVTFIENENLVSLRSKEFFIDLTEKLLD